MDDITIERKKNLGGDIPYNWETKIGNGPAKRRCYKNCTGKKPKGFILNGFHSIESWTDLMVTYHQILKDIHVDDFYRIVELTGKEGARYFRIWNEIDQGSIHRDIDPSIIYLGSVRYINIEGTDIWMNIGIDSQRIAEVCYTSAELFGHNDFEIVLNDEIIDDKNNNKSKNEGLKMELTLVSAEDVERQSEEDILLGAPVVDAQVIENYYALNRSGNMGLYTLELHASEVNYGSVSIPKNISYNNILEPWLDKKVNIGDYRTGLRITGCKMSKQQFWVNGITNFWAQYPAIQDIANAYKGETDKIIGKKKVGFLVTEGILEIVFMPFEISESELSRNNPDIPKPISKLIEEPIHKPIERSKVEISTTPETEKKTEIYNENKLVCAMYETISMLLHQITKAMFDNIYISLKTSQIVILSGTNGIGKNRIIELIARLTSKSFKEQFDIMEVGPEFYDSKTILVKYNTNTGKYEPTKLLNMLARAIKYFDDHHFFVFDESNTAHPEQYAAAILSAIETLKELSLPPGYDIVTKYGKFTDKIRIPKNISFIFTVNMDETTFKLAPKTIDRTIVIDMIEPDTEEYLDLIINTENPLWEDEVEGKFAKEFKKYFIDDEIRKNKRSEIVRTKAFRDYVIKNRDKFTFFRDINERLEGKSLRGFAAFRMLIDTICYMIFRDKLNSGDLPENKALDFIISQKILSMIKFNKGNIDLLTFLREFSEEKGCIVSIEKIDRMIQGLRDDDYSEFCR